MPYRDSPKPVPVDVNDFENYLAKRRVRLRWVLPMGMALMLAFVAVPFVLMKFDVISSSVFEIFCAVDFLAAVIVIRSYPVWRSTLAEFREL